MHFRLLLFLVVLSLASCLNSKDYDLNEITLTPTLALPLASGEISMMDLISNKDSAYLKVYPDGLLYLSYPKVFPSEALKDLFKVPNKSAPSYFTLPAGTLPSSSTNTTLGTITPLIDFGFSPQKLSEMLLKGGTLTYSISLSQNTTPALPIEVNVVMTDVVSQAGQVPLTFTTGLGSGSKSLKDYIIRMNANTFSVRFDIVVKPHAATFIPSNTKVNIQLLFMDLNFRYVKGFLGDQTVSLPQQTVPITIFSTSLNKSKVSFVEPKITFSVDNYYGVPCEITLSKLQAEKTGNTLPLQVTPSSPFSLVAPTVIGNAASTSLTVTNPGAVINFSPTQMVYAGSIRINKGLTSGANFLTDSTLRVTLNSEIPLYGQATGISLLDTLKVDFGSLNESSITTSSLKIKTVNEMPLDASIQLYFADQSYHILDSVFTSAQSYLVKASDVTIGGELLKASSTDLKVDISAEKANKLFSSSYLIIRSKMSTAKDANGTLLNVKFKSGYKLKMNVGLLAKMNIKSK